MSLYQNRRLTGICSPYSTIHIYNEEEVDEMIMLIRDSFIPAFTVLKDTLVKKLEDAESNWI